MKTTKFLEIKTTKAGGRTTDYEYAERKGTHSVAFLLYDPNSEEICYRLEHKPPVNAWVLGAFGGSIDPKKSLVDIVINEVKEESGYSSENSDVKFVGKYLVSTQMNQYCYLFAVNVNREYIEPKPTTTISDETIASNHWMYTTEHPSLECWKADIISKYIRKEVFCNE